MQSFINSPVGIDISDQQSLLQHHYLTPKQYVVYKDEKLPENEKSTLNIIITYGLAITIIVLTIIAISSVDDNFRSKCGDDGKNLFNWMIFRLVIIIVEPLILLALGHIVMIFMDITYGPIFGFVFKFILSLLLFILGTIFTSKVMYSEDCVNAMTNASFTKSPLLGIMGWVFVSIDALIIATFVFGMCSFISIFMSFRYTH